MSGVYVRTKGWWFYEKDAGMVGLGLGFLRSGCRWCVCMEERMVVLLEGWSVGGFGFRVCECVRLECLCAEGRMMVS